jgi:hypothetical protein
MKRISMATRDELLKATILRYRSATSERSRMLDEFAALTGLASKARDASAPGAGSASAVNEESGAAALWPGGSCSLGVVVGGVRPYLR